MHLSYFTGGLRTKDVRIAIKWLFQNLPLRIKVDDIDSLELIHSAENVYDAVFHLNTDKYATFVGSIVMTGDNDIQHYHNWPEGAGQSNHSFIIDKEVIEKWLI